MGELSPTVVACGRKVRDFRRWTTNRVQFLKLQRDLAGARACQRCWRVVVSALIVEHFTGKHEGVQIAR